MTLTSLHLFFSLKETEIIKHETHLAGVKSSVTFGQMLPQLLNGLHEIELDRVSYFKHAIGHIATGMVTQGRRIAFTGTRQKIDHIRPEFIRTCVVRAAVPPPPNFSNVNWDALLDADVQAVAESEQTEFTAVTTEWGDLDLTGVDDGFGKDFADEYDDNVAPESDITADGEKISQSPIFPLSKASTLILPLENGVESGTMRIGSDDDDEKSIHSMNNALSAPIVEHPPAKKSLSMAPVDSQTSTASTTVIVSSATDTESTSNTKRVAQSGLRMWWSSHKPSGGGFLVPKLNSFIYILNSLYEALDVHPLHPSCMHFGNVYVYALQLHYIYIYIDR